MKTKLTCLLVTCILLLGTAEVSPSTHQVPQSGFTIEQVLSLPFPADLVASPAGSQIAWTLNERGQRNIYVAETPDFLRTESPTTRQTMVRS